MTYFQHRFFNWQEAVLKRRDRDRCELETRQKQRVQQYRLILIQAGVLQLIECDKNRFKVYSILPDARRLSASGSTNGRSACGL